MNITKHQVEKLGGFRSHLVQVGHCLRGVEEFLPGDAIYCRLDRFAKIFEADFYLLTGVPDTFW